MSLRHRPRTSTRKAFLLPMVLVIVATLSLAVSIFAEQMLAEYRVTTSLAAQLVAGSAADSGVDYAMNLAESSSSARTHQMFKPQELVRSAAGFAVIRSWRSLDQLASDNYGLSNESGKLNLNGLPTGIEDIPQVRQRLMQLPRMTPQIADAIMDWIDSDGQVRPVGAEASWYSAQASPRLPAQRPLKDLSELLLIRGITPELLYGEDTNGNDWLDANENDGDISMPADNGDGRLDRGWSAFLTVFASESNLRAPQLAKVDLNQADLVQLYDQLLPLLGQDATQFVVAMRLDGPRQRGSVVPDSEQAQIEERKQSLDARVRSQLDKQSRSQSAREVQIRGGLDLSAEPAFRFRSLVDLIDQEVLTIRDGQQALLKSPWETSQLDAALDQLERVCTTQPGPQNLARINLAYAPLEVLRTIPGLDANKAMAIVARSPAHQHARSIGWLVSEGLLSLEQLREVAPFITVGGDVWRGTAVGWAVGQATGVARHFVIDTSVDYPRIITVQDSLPLRLKDLKGLVP